VAKRIAAEYEVTTIRSSPLLRARETADQIATECGLPVTIDDRFVDIDYGGWAGKPPDEMSEQEARAFMKWLRDPAVALPGAEEPQAVEARAMAGLEEISISGTPCAVVVSHDAVLQLILRHILGLPWRSYRGIGQHTGALSEVSRDDHDWTVGLLNSTWHLEVPGVTIPIEFGGP
jgi:probable phosphoglycerate mutase